MEGIIDYLMGVLMEDYRDPLTRMQIFALDSLPYLEIRSGILGRKVTPSTKTVRVYLDGRCVAKVYGSRIQKKTSQKRCSSIDAVCSDLEKAIRSSRRDDFSRVLDYPSSF